MPNVNRNTNENSGWQSWDNAQTPAGASPPCTDDARHTAITPAQNAAVQFAAPREEVAFNGDSRLEHALRSAMGTMQSGDVLELQTKGELKDGVAVGGETTLRAEKRSDGTFTLELEGKGEVGAGAPLVGSLKQGIGGGIKFHLDDANQTADLADAIIKSVAVEAASQSSLLVDGGVSFLRAANVQDDLVDAPQRVGNHLKKTSELKGSALLSATGGDDVKLSYAGFDLAKLEFKATLSGKDEMKLDLEKGEFTRSRSLSFTESNGVQVANFLNVGASEKQAGTISAVYKLPPEMKARLKEGTLSATEVAKHFALRAVPDELRLKGEIEVSAHARSYVAGETRAKLSSELTFQVNDFDAAAAMDALAKARWKVESETSVGLFSPKVSVGFASAEVNASKRHKWDAGQYTLPEAMAEAQSLLASTDQDRFAARLATANTR